MSRAEETGARIAARLAARTAHDLNNLAAVFSGHIYLLRGGAESPEEGYEAMETALAHLQRLTRSLTALGTVGTEEAADVDVNQVLRDAVSSAGGKVEVDLAEPLPPIRGRRRDIQNALGALLANAREAAGPDAPIRARTRADGDSIALSIHDSGPGVTPAVRQRSFDPLFSTKGEKGRGIGLTVARLVAALHGGRLTVEDDAEGGTRVSLVLPVSGGSETEELTARRP